MLSPLNQPVRVILSGGGTGGHLYPALTIAAALKAHHPANVLLFVGALGKMEMEQVPAAGYPIVGLNIRGFQRKRFLQNWSLPFRLATSLWKAKSILQQFKPAVVIGTGGYASGPVLYEASKMNIPTLVQEQNAYAGLTNRLLAKQVHRVCVAYEGMEQYFPADKIIFTGNPVRTDLMHLTHKRAAALAYFGLKLHQSCLLVLGGSLGAHTINQSILQALPQLIAAGVQLIWATGRSFFSAIQGQLPQQYHTCMKVYPFIDKIALAYAAADVVISRAGALAISELCMVRKPVIFVPSPNVVADHQTKNVQPLLAKGAALLVRDQAARQQLVPTALQLLRNTAQQKRMAHHIGYWARPGATAHIVAEILKLTHV